MLLRQLKNWIQTGEEKLMMFFLEKNMKKWKIGISVMLVFCICMLTACGSKKSVNVDKFAHVADMKEIEENGYNLNIPRYVDTFEEEEPVDLGAVKSKIQTLDSETKAAIDKAESFMRQLGL